MVDAALPGLTRKVPWVSVATHKGIKASGAIPVPLARLGRDSIRPLVKRVYIDSTIAGLGIKNCSYWFNAFSNCTEVRGFENLSGMTSANQMFSSCTSLETIYADSTWALPSSGITGSQCFYSCSTSLVGGNGTTWASNKTAYTYFRIDTASAPGYITAV